jgi:DNA-directed RNA polymerase specialized sigma24 family protein
MTKHGNSWLTEDLMMKVRRHAKRVSAVRMNFVDVHDIEQDLFYEICKAIKFWDEKRGNRSTFIESVLSNRSKNYLRNHFTIKNGGNIFFETFEESDDLVGRISDMNNDPKEDLLRRIDLMRAEESLSLLQLQIYIFLKNHSITEIAKILNMPYASLHFEIRKILEGIRYAINSQKNLCNCEYRYWKGVNMKNLSILETSSAKEISTLEVHDLMDLNDHVAKLVIHAKELKEKLDDGLNLRFSEAVKNNLRSESKITAGENKDTGTTRFFDGAFQIVAEIPKKVTWDTEKMEELIKRIPDDRRKDIVKISYSIEERKYSALPHEYQELFREARTITPGKTKFQIILGDGQCK